MPELDSHLRIFPIAVSQLLEEGSSSSGYHGLALAQGQVLR